MPADKEISPSHSQERLFWPRTSEVVGELAEALTQAPERPLTEEEKEQVLAFEKDLFAGRYGNLETEASLAAMVTTEDNSVQFVPSYLMTEAGRREFEEMLGISLPETDDETVIVNTVRTLPRDVLTSEDNEKKLQSLQGSSLDYLKSAYAAMAQGEREVSDIATVTVIKDTDKTLSRLSTLRQNKAFIQQVRQDLRGEEATDLNAAKLMVTDIYRDKVNAMLADAYPTLLSLRAQYEANGEAIAPEYTAHLAGMLKVAEAAESSASIRSQFVRLLDYVRNGAALDEEDKLTPIDPQIFRDAKELNALKPTLSEAHFTPEEIEELQSYVFDSLEMQAFIDAYLARTGLDKEEWKTEVRADIKAFAVSGITKKIKIPGKFKAAVAREYPSTGVVGLLEHEIGGKKAGHVMQSVNTTNNPHLFEIAKSTKFRGKRYLAMREAGGVSAEADAMKRFFGQTRKFNVSYAAAMKELIAGKPHAAAVAAFAEAHLEGRAASEQEKAKAYELAADRVMRLLRGGGMNSQPLQYVEGVTVRKVAAELPEEVVDVMLTEAVYDPVDMMRLHTFGLLPTDSSHRFQPEEDPEAVVMELLRERLDAKA